MVKKLLLKKLHVAWQASAEVSRFFTAITDLMFSCKWLQMAQTWRGKTEKFWPLPRQIRVVSGVAKEDLTPPSKSS